MDNVVTSLLVVPGDGTVSESAGGYSDYEARRALLEKTAAETATETAPDPETSTPSSPAEPPRKRKLSYKDQRELDALPAKIEALETRQQDLEARVSEPTFYSGERSDVDATLAELTQVQTELEQAFDRWAELDEQAG